MGGLVTYLLSMAVDSDGHDVAVFEVERGEVPDDLALASSDPSGAAARARVTLEQALDQLKPSLRKIVHLLKEISPDETELEFGLKIGGETGIVVAKGTAKVNFSVRMTWKAE
jgi:hypothetical protein